MSETPASYAIGDPGDEQHNWLAGKPVEMTTTGYVPRGGLRPDIRPGETPDEAMTRRRQARRERSAPAMKPTLAEWEAAGRAYQDAVDREDVDAMREADETFWELAGRLIARQEAR